MHGNLYWGFFNTSILELFIALRAELPAFDYLFIRSIDSEPDPVRLGIYLTRKAVSNEVSERGVLVPKFEFPRCVSPGILNGFDDVWLLSAKPSRISVPAPIITSDSGPISEDEARATKLAMDVMNCPLACGDGCGLNCITASEPFWTKLNTHFQQSR